MSTSAAADRAEPPPIIIEVVTGRVPLGLAEIWAYRELVQFLVWRDLKVRYAQPLSGVGWAIAQPFLPLAGMLVYSGAGLSLRVVWLPALLLLACVTALGAGLWLAAMSVRYRDVRHLVPFLTQLWFFATPIAYPSSLLHEPWRTVYG